MQRREFMTVLGGSAAGLITTSADASASPAEKETERPNILWISAEDISPILGCYGDSYAEYCKHTGAFFPKRR